MRIRHCFAAVASLLALVAAPASAQSCAGFTDVASGSQFCQNIEWVKNRAITTGCGGSTTTYCPTAGVTREQMAAFLNRLGNALTPLIIEPVPQADSVTQLDLATPKVVCASGDILVSNYPRRALLNGRLNLYNPSANGDFVADVVYTDDAPGSTAWKPLPLAISQTFQTMYGGFTPSHDVSIYPSGYLNLDVGKTYRFGLRVSRYTGTTANVAAYCTNFITLASRTGATSPYDTGVFYAPAADEMPPQGRAIPRP